MAEPFRVDPTVLADAVARMAEFGRHVEELVAEIESLVTRLHVTWTGEGAAAHAEAPPLSWANATSWRPS